MPVICKSSGKRQKGFTLVEVMVALMILAVALSALVMGMGAGINTTVHLREKTLAHWVALNKLAEMRIAKEWPRPGIIDGEYEMTGREWLWTVTVSETPDENIRRLDVSIYVDDRDDGAVATALAYLGNPG